MNKEIEVQSPEVAHVLFMDIVGYSLQSTTSQARLISELTDAVNSSRAYESARQKGKVLALPTGDGMALLFFDDVFAPAECALDVARAGNTLRIRMGIHSGLVQRQTDIAGFENVVGEGINTAQRVMSAAEEGKILLSSQYANWLRQFEQWMPKILELGKTSTKHGQELEIFGLLEEGLPQIISDSVVAQVASALNVVIVYRRNTQPDDQVLTLIESSLTDLGHKVFVDRHLRIGVDWAQAIEQKIKAADAVIAILSDAAIGSEMLEYELETAYHESKRRGKPYLLPIRVGTDKIVEGAIGAYVNELNFSVWRTPQDNSRVVTEIASSIMEPPAPKEETPEFEPVGGAMAPDSRFYVERDTDAQFRRSIKNVESILLVKGPRQMGKTSLLGRGARLSKDLGYRVVTTDFQKLSVEHLKSDDAFYRVLAATLARQLKFEYDFASEWVDVFGATMNMDNFIRAVIEDSERPIVWFMDEADRMFGVPFASNFFGLIRSWHNARATEFDGSWAKLSIVIAYATEAHLFIQDLNQSPFNVGRQIPLRNFTLEETSDLNVRYGSPINSDQVQRLWDMISGQPFLTRRALDTLARKAMTFDALMESVAEDDGPFGDHLKRILIAVSHQPEVLSALKTSISEPQLQESEGLHRLIASGVAKQTQRKRVELACELYKLYLSSHIVA